MTLRLRTLNLGQLRHRSVADSIENKDPGIHQTLTDPRKCFIFLIIILKAVLISTLPVEIRKTMALSYFHRGGGGQIYFIQYELFTYILLKCIII